MQKLALPDHCDDFYHGNLYFGECRGHLHLVMEQKQHDFIFHMMEVKKDFSGWNFLYCIDLKFMRDIYVSFSSRIRVSFRTFTDTYMVLGEGEEDYELLIIMTGPRLRSDPYSYFPTVVSRILSYNLVDKTYRVIMDVTHTRDFYTFIDMEPYHPMLTTL